MRKDKFRGSTNNYNYINFINLCLSKKGLVMSESAKDLSYENEYHAGYREGFSNRSSVSVNSYSVGYEEGYEAGYHDGYDNGYEAGYHDGYDNGYEAGY